MWQAALLAIASVTKASGRIFEGEAQAAQYEAFGRANDYNALIKRYRAETSRQSYGLQEEAFRRSSRIAAGSRHAAIGQSGTGTGGSNALVDAQSEVFAELDALNIRYKGELEAWGLESDAAQDEYMGGVNRMNAGNVRQSAQLGALGDLIGGGAQAYGASNGFNSTKPGTGTGPAPRMFGLYGNYPTVG